MHTIVDAALFQKFVGEPLAHPRTRVRFVGGGGSATDQYSF